MASKWTTISTHVVEPEVKRDPDWMECSPLDYVALGYKSHLFLYKPDSAAGSVPQIDRLVDSLGKTLTLFYPFAGRLIRNVKFERPRLHCNNAGALFTHKRYHGVASELIDEENFLPTDELAGVRENGITPWRPVYDPSGLPTLLIQVTDFDCGSRCVSVSFSHQVADAFAFLHFLSSWAEICRGEQVSSVPVHDRSLLSRRKSSPVLDEGAPVRFLNNQMKDPVVVQFKDPEHGKSLKTMKLTNTRMQELKAQGVRDCDGTGVNPTSTDCVSANLWRWVAEKREYKPDDVLAFHTYVNLRSRLKNFPQNYFGNGVIVACCSLTVQELRSKSLGELAAVIQEANKAVNEDLVRDWIDWNAVNKFHLWSVGDEPVMLGDPNVMYHVLRASYVNRASFYDLDFGTGKPSASLRNDMVQLIGGIWVMPSSKPGELRVEVYAENQLLDKLPEVM
ncbi:hypothetical protein R1sor_016058 [Riccia sorocarpa]|uniref:Uncharacterized protein n=1 Tax=Riccia sorocarpa TaxID=122646 RepID=A0ABD3HK42_9MARC